MSAPHACPRCAGQPWLRNELCPACEAIVAAASEPPPYYRCERHDQEFPVGETCAGCETEARFPI